VCAGRPAGCEVDASREWHSNRVAPAISTTRLVAQRELAARANKRRRRAQLLAFANWPAEIPSRPTGQTKARPLARAIRRPARRLADTHKPLARAHTYAHNGSDNGRGMCPISADRSGGGRGHARPLLARETNRINGCDGQRAAD
jgi:hypothetical protein